MDIKTILNERQVTHGDFTDHARVSQALQLACINSINWDILTDTHREALTMICHKLARILAGNPCHKDHWDDIVGYATLASKELKDA